MQAAGTERSRIEECARREDVNYHVVFTRDPETTSVVAEIPALLLADFGADVPEALERLQAMANVHLDCLVQEGKPIPSRSGRRTPRAYAVTPAGSSTESPAMSKPPRSGVA